MSNENINLAHISADYSKYEAARTGFFTFVLDVNDDDFFWKVNASEADKASDNDSAKIMGVQEALKLSVTKFDVPHFTIDPLEYTRGNEKLYFAGTPKFNSSGSLTVEDFVGLDTKSILMAWQGAAYNVNTRKGGRMADYKRDCTLYEYTQDFEEVRHWKLYGCWVTEISEQAFDVTADDKRQLEAKIQYDRAVMFMPGQN